MILIGVLIWKGLKLTNSDVFWRKMPLANVHTPFFYLFSETCVDNSVSRYNVQWRLSPAFLVFVKNTDPLVFWLSWLATPKYWAVCLKHRLIYSVSVMAANFQRAPLMSRDDLNFLAITYSPETGPFPDTPLERLCLKVEVEEKMRHLESKNPPSPLSTLVRRSALLTAVAMNGQKLLFNCTLYFGRINYVTLANWTTKQHSWENSWIIPTY